MQMISSYPDIFNIRSLGLMGLVVFAFFGWLGAAGSAFGAVILSIGLLFNVAAYWRKMYRQPLFWLSLGAIFFTFLHWQSVNPIDEQSARYAERYAAGLIYLWLFSVIAWHLYRRDVLARWVVGLASFGLCIQVLMETDWHNLANFVQLRQDFGFSVAGVALHSALSVWGLLLLIIFAYRKYRGWLKWGVVVFALIGIVILSEALILTQSRAGWVALLVAVILTGILFISKERLTLKAAGNQQLVVLGVTVSLLLGVLLVTNFNKLSDRMMAEREVYTTLLSFDRTKIPYSSVGARAHMLLYGIELWQEKPLLGWGIGSSRSLLAMDDVLKPYDHPHFHNNYLELLVEQGAVGLLFYLLAFILLMHGFFKAYSESVVAKDLFYYLVGAWLMVLIWSLADSRMVHVDVRFALLLLSGISFSVILGRGEKAISNSG